MDDQQDAATPPGLDGPADHGGAPGAERAAGTVAAPPPQAAHPADPPDGMVRLLEPDGTRRTDGLHAAPVAHVDAEGLRERYRRLALARRFDDEATALQRQGELGLWASMRGQEGAQVGAAAALLDQDRVFPTYREHALAMARGVGPASILALFRGVDHGGWDPADHGFSLYTLVIGSQTLHATGYAMGVQRDGAVGTGDAARDTAVLACFGDGASSQGDVNEAFVFAAAFHLPVVFFCQNNQWAISVPASRQSRLPLHRRADGFGFPGVRVDGNDVLACEAVLREALERARSGGGPTLVEAWTYRLSAHTTADDTSRYRSLDEERAWAERDPLLRVRRHLEATGAADAGWFAGLDAEVAAFAADVRRRCLALPDPEPATIFDHVYGDAHPPLEGERAGFEAYRAGVPAEEVPA